MKKILMSIHPEWCEKIFNCEKTIEVRKSRPKLEPPFEVYVYCTRSRLHLYKNPNNGEVFLDRIDGYRGGDYENRYLTGKVIGTFVCDKVEKFTVGSLRSDDIERQAWLSYSELINYFYNGKEPDGETVKWGYGWHITEPKLLNSPLDVRWFNKPYPFTEDCDITCPYAEGEYHGDGINGDMEFIGCNNKIIRAPQSWCYVEV